MSAAGETFSISSDLAAPRDAVWRHISSMAGINQELAPLSMTYPASVAELRAEAVPLGQVLFRSWVLLYGVLPIDRHALRLMELRPGEGFHEDSTSWLQRRWVHERWLAPIPGGCRVIDRLRFTPRLGLLRPLVAAIVRATFERRHRRLRQRFQLASSSAGPSPPLAR